MAMPLALRISWTVALCGLLSSGCSVEGSRSVGVPSFAAPGELLVAALVGPEGGLVSGGGGGVALSFAPGALAAPTLIEVRQLDAASLALPEGMIASTLVELSPDGISFAKPVELAFRLDESQVRDPDSPWLRVAQVLPDGSLGRTEFIGYDRQQHRIRAKLAHFSSYGVADLTADQASFESSEERVDQVDVLVLVDDSPSMHGEQENLARNFTRLADKLRAAGLDYRVGVLSPDLGAGDFTFPTCETPGGLQGKLQTAARQPGCTPPTDPWIASHGAESNVPGGDIAAAFSCIARLGAGGCSFEQPLEALYRAVDPAVNPGFLRDDAALAVLLITDEDDCSARDPAIYDVRDQRFGSPVDPNFRCFEYGVQCDGSGDEDVGAPGPRTGCKPREDGYLHPVSRYVDRLRQLKPEGKVVVSLVAGPASPVAVEDRAGLDGLPQIRVPRVAPSCSGEGVAAERDGSHAFPAIRLEAFADAFGEERSSFTSICEQDFSPALDRIGDLVVRTHALSWCLPYDPEDTNSATPELEADCVVEAGKLGVVPSCGSDPDVPCYTVVKNTGCTDSTSQLELRNARPEDPGQGQVRVTCLIP